MDNEPIKDRIRVLFIVQSLRRAGAETQLVNLVNGLDPKDFDKHLLVFEKQVDQLDRVDRETVRFHQTLRTRRRLDLRLVDQIARVIEENRIDVVHCTLQFPLLWGWLASARTTRRPTVIAALHTTINRDLKSELQDRLLYQWILRRCEGIIFVCESQKAYWEARYPFLAGRSEVVYNGVDTEWFEPKAFQGAALRFREQSGIPADAVLLASIARFDPEKGQHLLVEACASLSDSPFHIVFAGDGPLRSEVELQARRLDLGERVRFIGEISDVRPLLAAADLLVLPSTAVETFSMAMLEALSMGTPVLGSNIGGMREAVLENRTGALVEPGDVAALAQKIASLTADRNRLSLMGAQGRDLVVGNFSEGLMIERTASIIRRLNDSAFKTGA
jgi:glycosyltransferase involved in cell wall biosynthesis